VSSADFPGAVWRTDEELASARQRFAAAVPGYVPPAAYGVARLDAEGLTFGEVNGVGYTHRLPAVVLATVCGCTSGTATFRLSAEQLREAITLLAPAEAAVHWEHPNLWTWRELLDGGDDSSTFLAFFVADPADPPVDDHDGAFRIRLTA
jgi:hypothetical protein